MRWRQSFAVDGHGERERRGREEGGMAVDGGERRGRHETK